MFESRMPRPILGNSREEEIEACRTLHNEGLNMNALR
jgi:hypothetical protein